MSSTTSTLLTVSVVRRKESSEWPVGRAPERLPKIVTSTVEPSIAVARPTRDVPGVRTPERVQLRRGGLGRLQYIGHIRHQLFHFGFRQRIAKRTIQKDTVPSRSLD